MTTIICLSPHSDDAALSCGGLLARSWEQRPQVITVFAGPTPPPEQLTPYARRLHRSWGGQGDPMARRREEDRCAFQALGCEGVWWEYTDAIYRHPAYDSEVAIFGPPAAEEALEEDLYRRLSAPEKGLFLFPLAVGHHVDHQLLFRMGWKLAQAGRRVAFYEDLPYVAWEDGPDARLDELPSSLHPQLLDVSASWPSKMAALSCYASQFEELTREGVPLLEAVERYAFELLPGGAAERLWWPKEERWI